MQDLDKKAIKSAKNDFALHLALIQKQDNCSLTDARFRAWLEGINGLAKRLGQMDPPLEPPKEDAPTNVTKFG